MTDDRESKLPQWAQALIADLRRRVEHGNEPLLREVAATRPRIQLLERRLGALEELVTCAAVGGHKTAQEIIDVLNSYALTLTQEQP